MPRVCGASSSASPAPSRKDAQSDGCGKPVVRDNPGSSDNDHSSGGSASSLQANPRIQGGPFVVNVDDQDAQTTIALRRAIRSIQGPSNRIRTPRGFRRRNRRSAIRPRPKVEDLADSTSSPSPPQSPAHRHCLSKRFRTACSSDDAFESNSNADGGDVVGQGRRPPTVELSADDSVRSLNSSSSSAPRLPTPDVGIDADPEPGERVTGTTLCTPDMEPGPGSGAEHQSSPLLSAPLPRRRPRRLAAPLTFVDAFGCVPPSPALARRNRAVADGCRRSVHGDALAPAAPCCIYSAPRNGSEHSHQFTSQASDEGDNDERQIMDNSMRMRREWKGNSRHFRCPTHAKRRRIHPDSRLLDSSGDVAVALPHRMEPLPMTQSEHLVSSESECSGSGCGTVKLSAVSEAMSIQQTNPSGTRFQSGGAVQTNLRALLGLVGTPVVKPDLASARRLYVAF